MSLFLLLSPLVVLICLFLFSFLFRLDLNSSCCSFIQDVGWIFVFLFGKSGEPNLPRPSRREYQPEPFATLAMPWERHTLPGILSACLLITKGNHSLHPVSTRWTGSIYPSGYITGSQ